MWLLLPANVFENFQKQGHAILLCQSILVTTLLENIQTGGEKWKVYQNTFFHALIYFTFIGWFVKASEDPTEMPHNTAFHQGLHSFLNPDKNIHQIFATEAISRVKCVESHSPPHPTKFVTFLCKIAAPCSYMLYHVEAHNYKEISDLVT